MQTHLKTTLPLTTKPLMKLICINKASILGEMTQLAHMNEISRGMGTQFDFFPFE